MPDHLGSTSRLLDSLNGANKAQYDYTSYGKLEGGLTNPSVSNPYTYTGREDDGTGLLYYRARYYDPELEVFISQDPLGDAQRYVNGNPLNLVDPLGLDWRNDMNDAIAGFASGATFGLTDYLRNKYNGGKTALGLSVNPCSGSFKAGGVAGAVAGAYAMGAGLRGAGALVGVIRNSAVVAEEGGALQAASNAANAMKLGKSLASEAQMSETGTIIAGPGSGTVFRNAETVAKEYGGNASDWVKKTSSSYTAQDGSIMETHWVENTNTGQRVLFKTKMIQP